MASAAQQKTDVVEHPQVFRHIGLLFRERSAFADLLVSSFPTSLIACVAEH
jgi:hypothetical protein